MVTGYSKTCLEIKITLFIEFSISVLSSVLNSVVIYRITSNKKFLTKQVPLTDVFLMSVNSGNILVCLMVLIDVILCILIGNNHPYAWKHFMYYISIFNIGLTALHLTPLLAEKFMVIKSICKISKRRRTSLKPFSTILVLLNWIVSLLPSVAGGEISSRQFLLVFALFLLLYNLTVLVICRYVYFKRKSLIKPPEVEAFDMRANLKIAQKEKRKKRNLFIIIVLALNVVAFSFLHVPYYIFLSVYELRLHQINGTKTYLNKDLTDHVLVIILLLKCCFDPIIVIYFKRANTKRKTVDYSLTDHDQIIQQT